MKLDNNVEDLTFRLPRRFAVGCLLIPAMAALAAADLGISVTPGQIVLDDHAWHHGGTEDLAVHSGETLAASSEVISDVVAYWNPAAGVGQIVVVDGAEALTADGAAAPTDAEVAAALPDSTYPWVRLGRVKFTTDGSSNVTLAEIENGVRPFEIDSTRKAVGTASSSHDKDPTGDGDLYEFAGYFDFEVDAADIADGDILTDIPLPLFYGKIGRTMAVATKAITTVAKASDLDFEINATGITGGQVALAGTYALGVAEAGSAITAGSEFSPGDTLSVVASSTTTFVEGRVKVVAELYRKVLA